MEDMFHGHGGVIRNDDDDGSKEWCDIGTETDKEWDKWFQRDISEAKPNEMSATGIGQLTSLLSHHHNTVCVSYHGGCPTRMRPLEPRFINNASPVRAKPRRCQPEMRYFYRKYMAQLLSLNHVKPAKRTECVSAPLIVPIKPPAMYRLAVDYRPINTAAAKNTWPMPYIEAVLQDVCGAQVFAAIDFTSG